MAKAPPSPFKVLRIHNVQINTLHFSNENEYLVAGDSSGRVSITSTRTFRPIADWNAHTDSVLGVQEWGGMILTHGRDNKLHFWNLTPPAPLLTDAASTPNLSAPMLASSMDVNALNYCRFSLYPTQSDPPRALLGLPNLIESELVDIWDLPGKTRLHAAIGTIKGAPPRTPFSDEGRDIYKTGIVMSLHVSQTELYMRVLVGYESGNVTLWIRRLSDSHDQLKEMDGTAFGIDGMAVTCDNTMAASVSADHLICRYDLNPEPGADAHSVLMAACWCAAGWDGAVRLYSTGLRRTDEAGKGIVIDRSRKVRSLGTLEHFKESCFAMAFANELLEGVGNFRSIKDEDNMSLDALEDRSKWLAVGGKTGRIAIWELDSFEKR
ncbi:WD40 repeat-like protein [Rhizoctonia solani]|uniref:ASTRA-associated protein 1 n=1 Tax=Rhizoctonia solani TaxID=456999 RepID=A0A8H7M1Y6_9AGAM|nr:WD40 repeat-like protein [Rhizoctonia solani]